MRTIFKSIAKSDETCFVWDSSNFHTSGAVDSSMLKYQTYGHGTTAHTPDYGISSDEFVDYCHSFADWMLANPTDAVELSGLYKLTQQCRPEVLEFAAGVKYKTAKPMFYSLDQRKVSGSDNKRNDRRYEEIRPYHDGGHESMYRILCKNFYSPLQRFLIQLEIREYLHSVDGNLCLPTPRLAEPSTDGDSGRRGASQRGAYEILKSTIAALQALEATKDQVSRYVNNLALEADRARVEELQRLEALELTAEVEAVEVLSGDEALAVIDSIMAKPTWTEVEAGLEAVAA